MLVTVRDEAAPLLGRSEDQRLLRSLLDEVATHGQLAVEGAGLTRVYPAPQQVADLQAPGHQQLQEPFGLARSNELKKTLKQMIELHADLAQESAASEDDE